MIPASSPAIFSVNPISNSIFLSLVMKGYENVLLNSQWELNYRLKNPLSSKKGYRMCCILTCFVYEAVGLQYFISVNLSRC